MYGVNPLALLLIALTTVIGALLGSWLIGLLVGLLVVFAGSVVQLSSRRRW